MRLAPLGGRADASRRVRGQDTHDLPAGGIGDLGGNVADETYTGEFYCVKCKAKRQATGDVVVTAKGTRMAKGKCPECGTTLSRILGKA